MVGFGLNVEMFLIWRSQGPRAALLSCYFLLGQLGQSRQLLVPVPIEGLSLCTATFTGSSTSNAQHRTSTRKKSRPQGARPSDRQTFRSSESHIRSTTTATIIFTAASTEKEDHRWLKCFHLPLPTDVQCRFPDLGGGVSVYSILKSLPSLV